MASNSERDGVQSVARVFKILEQMNDLGGNASLSELSESTSIPIPTIHRLLRTLLTLGYVRQLPNRRYSLGPRLIRLGDGANRQLGTRVQPQLKKLVDHLEETANLAVLDSDMVLYVAQVPSRHSMRMFTEVGRRAYLHATGVGKAILAQLPDDQIATIVARTGFPTLTEHSLDNLDDLTQELERIRERGYAIDDGEQELGVRCYAMAIPGAPTPMAISVSGPVTRIDQSFAERAIPLLQRAVVAIEAELQQ